MSSLSDARIDSMRRHAEFAYTVHMDDATHADGWYPDVFHDLYCDVSELLAERDRLIRRIQQLVGVGEYTRLEP